MDGAGTRIIATAMDTALSLRLQPREQSSQNDLRWATAASGTVVDTACFVNWVDSGDCASVAGDLEFELELDLWCLTPDLNNVLGAGET